MSRRASVIPWAVSGSLNEPASLDERPSRSGGLPQPAGHSWEAAERAVPVGGRDRARRFRGDRVQDRAKVSAGRRAANRAAGNDAQTQTCLLLVGMTWPRCRAGNQP